MCLVLYPSPAKFLPSCRILNRFTKDMYFMDDFLPMTLHDFLVCTFMVVGSTILVMVANPWVLLR